MSEDVKHTMSNGGTGLIASAAGFIASCLPQVEIVLKIVLLLLSIAVTSISLYRLLRHRGARHLPTDNSIEP